MADTISRLKQLGFSEYEARAYIALVQCSPQNGYEVAKASGLPRANVYNVLQKLEERGAIIRMNTPDSTRYAAIPPEELTQRISQQFREILDVVQKELEEISAPVEPEYVWNTRGYEVMLEQAKLLIDACQQDLLIATWPQEACALDTHLASAEARGTNITTLCLSDCPEMCGCCYGRVYRYRVPPEERSRWLLCIPDGESLLAGEIASNKETIAVRTQQSLLVSLAGWYIRHSIALAAALTDLNDRLETLLTPETQAILNSVGPNRFQGWLAHMRQLLNRQPPNPIIALPKSPDNKS